MLFNVLITTLLVTFSNGIPTDKGKEKHPINADSKIVGGEDTTIEKYPHQVSLELYGFHICGGSIISKYHVLTAAHCLMYGTDYLSIRAGSTYLGEGGKVYRIKHAVIHEKYDYDDYGVPLNDIALLRVTESFRFGSTIKRIALFRNGEPSKANATSIVTGWGMTEDGYLSSILQTVTVPIVDWNICKKANEPYTVHKGMICAGYLDVGGKGPCYGDSGSALTIKGRQAGIASWTRGCAHPDYPTVFVEVAYYRNWINRNVKI